MYEAINTAGTGLATYQTWLDTIANNIANMNDTSSTSAGAFHSEYVDVQQIGGNNSTGQGVEVTSFRDDGGSTAEYDPTNPQAGANGYVYHSDVNLSEQMGDMIAAQRAFQANANAVNTAQQVYQAAMSIGKGI